jgi:membrane protein
MAPMIVGMFTTLKNLKDYAQRVLVRMTEERLSQAAASLTFTTVLAIVPLATVTLAVFTAFPMFGDFRAALQDYFLRALMPAAISEQVMGFINNFAGKARGLTIMGVIFLVVTALAMMLTVEGALNQIWRTRRSGKFMSRMVTYWGALTLGPVLLGISLYLTGMAAASVAGINVKVLTFVPSLMLWFVPVLLAALGWALVYKTVPHASVSWRHAFIGALVAALLFELIKRGFAIYLTRFANYRELYGAFAVVPIFLLWLFLCWLITLAGAVIAALAPSWGRRDRVRTPRVGDALADAIDVLRALQRARSAEPFALDFEALIEQTDLPRIAAQDALAKLQTIGWVSEIAQTEEAPLRYAFIADPAAVSFKPLLDATVLDATHPKLAFLSARLATMQSMSLADVVA